MVILTLLLSIEQLLIRIKILWIDSRPPGLFDLTVFFFISWESQNSTFVTLLHWTLKLCQIWPLPQNTPLPTWLRWYLVSGHMQQILGFASRQAFVRGMAGGRVADVLVRPNAKSAHDDLKNANLWRTFDAFAPTGSSFSAISTCLLLHHILSA